MADDALTHVDDHSIVGLGSGGAATAFAVALGRRIKDGRCHVTAVPTSMQIKLVAEKACIPLVEADQVDHIDAVFDGADQIDSEGFVIKGGGGALLRENILFNLARKVVVMADRTKFVKSLTRTVPVEIHPLARTLAAAAIRRIGGKPGVRTSDKGYPLFTENGGILLDCDFGTIGDPAMLTRCIKEIPGVLESGIFLRRPDVIYKAGTGGRFDVL